jgi:hypothetical protein
MTRISASDQKILPIQRVIFAPDTMTAHFEHTLRTGRGLFFLMAEQLICYEFVRKLPACEYRNYCSVLSSFQ